MRDFVARLTSEEGRAWLRRAAKLVLRFTGDEPGSSAPDTTVSSGPPAPPARSAVEDAASIMSAVAKGAAVASGVTASLRSRASRGGFGKVALGLGAGLAIGGAVVYLASPEGREKVRSLWHRARGWRRARGQA
jgi:hypothetical protein